MSMTFTLVSSREEIVIAAETFNLHSHSILIWVIVGVDVRSGNMSKLLKTWNVKRELLL